MTGDLEGEMRKILARAIASGQGALSEFESKIVVGTCVPVTREALARSRQEAIDKAVEIGFPVVLKGSSPALTHKTEMDMVRVNLKDVGDVGRAYDDLTGRGIDLEGVLVQEMVRGKREFVIGMTRDPQFGPCVMFGLGGVLTEALRYVAFRVAPLTEDDAREMIDEIRAKKLLNHFRGESPVDRDAIVQALIGVGHLGMTYDEIAEIDINPLIVRDGRPVAVDAVVFLRS